MGFQSGLPYKDFSPSKSGKIGCPRYCCPRNKDESYLGRLIARDDWCKDFTTSSFCIPVKSCQNCNQYLTENIIFDKMQGMLYLTHISSSSITYLQCLMYFCYMCRMSKFHKKYLYANISKNVHFYLREQVYKHRCVSVYHSFIHKFAHKCQRNLF